MENTNEYEQAESRFAENLATAEQTAAAQVPAPALNQELLAKANAMQIEKDENGRRRYHEDSVFRDRTEAIRIEAFGGPPVPVKEAQPQTPSFEVVEPQGTPQERAALELNERLDSGDVVDVSEVQKQLSGYTIQLPEGFGLDQTAIHELAAARKAGLTQRQVDVMVAEIVRGQQ